MLSDTNAATLGIFGSKWHSLVMIHSSNADLTSILIDGGLGNDVLRGGDGGRSLVEMALTVWRVRTGTIFWSLVLVRIASWR